MTTERRIYPPNNRISYEACFFRRRKADKNTKWHRIINHFAKSNVHLAYCGRIESFNEERMEYAGAWNAGQFRGSWIECEQCEILYADN